MRVLVFGASGFIGRYLVQRLLNEGSEVVGVSRTNLKGFSKNKKYVPVSVDIIKREDFKKIPQLAYDAAFNISAYIPGKSASADSNQECLEVNITGVLNILDYVFRSNIKHYIHSSSASVYGLPKKILVKETAMTAPNSIYGFSKLAGEELCSLYRKMHGLQVVVLRYSSVYGTLCKADTVLPLFVDKARRNEDITLLGEGERSQDFVYVDDVIEANVRALRYGKSGVFNIGSGEETSMKKLARIIIRVSNSKSNILFDKSRRENFRMMLNIDRAKRELAYWPRFDLRIGVEKYIQSL